MKKEVKEYIYKLYNNKGKFSEQFLNAKTQGLTWFIYKHEDKAMRLDVSEVSSILTEFEEVSND